jgi:DNA-binding NtrC family response regulator
MNNLQRSFTLLLVDDEPAVIASLRRLFRKEPYEILTAENGEGALAVLQQNRIDASVIDLKMPGMDGMALLEKIRAEWPSVKVLMLTGHGGVAEAVQAVKLGAVDFLQKHYEPESLLSRIHQLHQIWSLEQENRQLKEQAQFQFGFEQLIGSAAAIMSLKKQILQVASADAGILIQGETGTGKELVARAIHYHSTRRDEPFVTVDCAGISEAVMGSELFGHVKGAFTGAHETTPGLVRAADKGTLFLDEVGELPLSMQVKLLRTLQEKEVRPVGASRNFPVDVRVLAATNRNLEKEVEEGRFRQDLFYRLNVVVLGVPPLRERREDIPFLARYLIERFKTPASPVAAISLSALTVLQNYDWPGNVRELENVIRRAAAMGQQAEITTTDLPEAIGGSAPAAGVQPVLESDTLEFYELAAIRNALTKCDGHRRKTAQMLGIGEATLYRKLNKYKLE